MEVEVISRETIKPSSPTPPHLRTHKLSLLDQIASRLYTPIVVYYKLPDVTHSRKFVAQLKTSLAETLTKFYPIAGRVKDRYSIDCNDEGALFVEAKVNCSLSEFLKNPKLDLMHKFVPCQGLVLLPTDSVVQFAVQANVFSDGQLGIGLCLFHRIIDGGTISTFLKSWAAIARGALDKVVAPDFVTGAEVFVPKELGAWDANSSMSKLRMSWMLKEGKGVWKRFCFDANAIAQLKQDAKSEQVANASGVAALTCFLWKQGMAASRAAWGDQHNDSSILSFSVNMRPRLSPPVPENVIGNLVWPAMAYHKESSTEDNKLSDLVHALRQSLAKTGHEIQEFKEDGNELIKKFRGEFDKTFAEEKPDMYLFVSWSKFGFEELDYGWGQPIWVSIHGGEVSPYCPNNLVLIDACDGNGIEAWLLMDEHAMAKLEIDPQFLKFARVNPSIEV